ncbi:MAG: spermine synthase [Deltaproteobacteria bacterium]|nr:spermine synthase [Deltaproteobacteria bacterium]
MAAAPRRDQRLFSLAMLLSGFAGVSYEILYARVLADIIGDQFAVAAAVLITFLLGIGTGAAVAHRLWRHLWAIEAGIGAYGLLIAVTAPALDRLLYASLPLLPGDLAGSILFGVSVLVLPAFLVGCSIPLFSGYLQRLGHGRAFPHVYAVYNFGAALTTLAIEFLLVRVLGIRGALMAIAAVNGVVALVVLGGFRHLGDRRALPRPPFPLRLPVPALELAAVVIASIASAVFQLLAVRLAEMLLGPFRETFALVLSLVLGGIALGAVLVQTTGVRLAGVLAGALLGLLLLLLGFQPLASVYSALYGPAAAAGLLGPLKWALLAALFGLPATAFGATLPALLRDNDDVARASGALLCVSSLANVAGFLLMTLGLHRWLDYGALVALLTALVAAALVALAVRDVQHWALGGASVTTALLLLAGTWDEDLLFLGYRAFQEPAAMTQQRALLRGAERFRGAQDVFAIPWRDGKPYLFINGYLSIPLNNPSEKVVGAVASLYAPRTDRALVLGLGSGATASAVGRLFDATDVVEINPVITENIGRMRQWNLGIEDNPRIRVVTDDGIHFMKASTDQYALVLNTVTTPLYFSSSKLYTQDFLEVARRRLAPGGVYLTWMDSRIGDRGAWMVLRTLRQVFPACSLLWAKATYFLLMCGEAAPRVPDPSRAARDAVITKDLLGRHDLMPQWLAYQLVVRDAFTLLGDQDVPVNTRDHPELEFEMARLRSQGVPRLQQRVLDALQWDDVVGALGEAAEPGALLAHAESTLGKDASMVRRWRRHLAERFPDLPRRRAEARVQRAHALVDAQGTAQARYVLAARLRDADRCADAIRELEAALTQDPRLDNAHYVWGHCLEELGRPEEALAQFRLEQQLDPADDGAARRITRLLTAPSP